MRRSVFYVAALVMAAGVLKQITWALWLPPGSLPEEMGQYLAIARSGEVYNDGMQSLAPKDLAELARYSRLDEGRLPMKSAQELQKLNAALERVTTPVFVPAAVSSPPSSSYHTLWYRMLLSLVRMDIRWRWIVMRLAGIVFLALAATFTYRALRHQTTPAAALAGMALVLYGPAAGMGAGLLGPSAFVACLWGAWILCMASLKASWQAASWAALLGLAMSSVDIQGGVACGVTLAAMALAREAPSGVVARAGRWPAIALCVIGLALWLFRLLTFPHTGSAQPWSAVLFGAPAALLPVPAALLVGWGLVACVALGGLAVAVWMKKAPAASAVFAALLVSLAVARIWPTPGMTAFSVAPLMAYLIVLGLGALWTHAVGWVALAAVAVGLDLAALILWVVPRLFA